MSESVSFHADLRKIVELEKDVLSNQNLPFFSKPVTVANDSYNQVLFQILFDGFSCIRKTRVIF